MATLCILNEYLRAYKSIWARRTLTDINACSLSRRKSRNSIDSHTKKLITLYQMKFCIDFTKKKYIYIYISFFCDSNLEMVGNNNASNSFFQD